MRKRLISLLLAAGLLVIGTGCTAGAPTDGSTTDEKVSAAEVQPKVYEIVEQLPANFGAKRSDVARGDISEISYHSGTTGTDRKAKIILPPDYSADKQYPVVYLLHGIGGDQNEWIGGGADNVIFNMWADGEAKDMIVVVPNVRARADDKANPSDIYTPEHFAAFDNFINDLRDDLMPYIEANYPVLTGKENTAVAGLSMGGREALYIGFSMPETFGYIGAFCPAPGILTYDNKISAESGLFTEEEFKLPEGSDNFILIVKGDRDYVVGEAPDSYHAALEKNGVAHEYYVTKGGHDFGVWKHGLNNFLRNLF